MLSKIHCFSYQKEPSHLHIGFSTSCNTNLHQSSKFSFKVLDLWSQVEVLVNFCLGHRSLVAAAGGEKKKRSQCRCRKKCVNCQFLFNLSSLLTMSSSDLCSTLSSVLSRLLSPGKEERQLAEQQLQALTVTEGEDQGHGVGARIVMN